MQPQWQSELKEAISDPAELISILQLDPSLLLGAQKAHRSFKVMVPRPFLVKITPGDPHDPLLRQVLPLGEEEIETPGYSVDPLSEYQANPIPGLLHKYKQRVLVTVTPACAINCRYCFRRHFPYSNNRLSNDNRQRIFDYIQQRPEINEIILSGGDPLIAPDNYLAELTTQLTRIDHIKRLRIHSRLPVTIPSRITHDFITWFAKPTRQNILVIHSNHPNELDSTIATAMQPLRQAGVTLLNQSVLLKGVNDNATVLAELSERLFDMGVLPYYLHLLDKVAGTAHFDLPLEQAQSIYAELQKILPGFLVPQWVKETAGELSKIRINAAN